MSWFMALGTCIAENCIGWPQWEGMSLILWKLNAPGKRALPGGELGVGRQADGRASYQS